MRRLSRWMTGFVAAVIEAWHELRIHKLRVLLSLIGVMVAVASLTTALAVAGIGQQVLVEQYEHSGRPAFLSITINNSQDGRAPSPERVRPALATVAERFDISHVSMAGNVWDAEVTHRGRDQAIQMRVVDPAYATIHRVVTTSGRWLETADTQNMSPAVVVDERLLRKLGIDTDRLPVTIDIGKKNPVTATVVGTVPRQQDADPAQPVVYVLAGSYEHWFSADQPLMDAMYEMWVPIEGSKRLASAIRRALGAEFPGYQVYADRQDYLAWGDDPFDEVALVVGGIAGVILLLGALSLLNVTLVTIQQRVREVGIRRSFGATTGRVFFSVMMESVVATVVAGSAGVLASVAIVNSPWVAEHLLEGIDDVPPFPVDAALLGLAVSVAVGALAGVVPAIVAARVKIIDAIRF